MSRKEREHWQAFVDGMQTALFACGRVAKSLKGKVSTEFKAADSPEQTSNEVSVVDRLCQEILMIQAHKLDPSLGVYSEEMASCPVEIAKLFEGNKKPNYTLIIDSLDGTKAYLEGRSDYCHMVGVLNNNSGGMVCGMLYAPEQDLLVSAIRECGCFVQSRLCGPREKWSRSSSVAMRVIRSKRMTERDFSRISALGLSIEDDEAMSSVAVLRLIAGSACAMVMRGFHGHDTAIGSIIVEECGGAALQEDGTIVKYDAKMARRSLIILSAYVRVAKQIWAGLK